jgi:WD40 repeat protein
MWPPETEMKQDPREFAWRYLNHKSRPAFSVVSGFPEKTPHYVMQVSEKTKTLWTGGTDGYVREIDPDSSSVKQSIKVLENPIESIDVSSDGKFLAIGNLKGELWLLNLSSLKIIDSRKIHIGEITDLKFSRDSKKIISTGKDGKLNIWNIESGKMSELPSQMKLEDNPYSSLYGISLLPEPNLVAVGTKTGAILIVDIQSLEIQHIYRGHHDIVYSIVLSTDWNWLVSVSQDYSICIWDLKKNILVNRINLMETGYTNLSLRDVGMKINKISSVVHLNHLSSIAVDSGNGVINLFHIPSGIKMGELRGNDQPAWSLAYLPWSKKVASFSRDLKMRIWNSPLTQNWSGPFFHFELSRDDLGREIPVAWYNPNVKDFTKTELEMINPVSAPFEYLVTDSIKCNSSQDLMTLQILPTTDFKMPAEHKIDYFFHASSDEINREPKSPKSIPIFRYSAAKRLTDAKLISHPNKPLAAFISTDKALHFIDYSDLEKPIVVEVASNVNHSVFVPESNQLLVLIGDGNPGHFFDYNQREWLGLWPSDDDGEWINASLSPDHSTLAVHRAWGRLQFWNLSERKLESEMAIPEVGRRRFREIQWLPDGQELVISMVMKDVFLIDRKSDRVLLNWDLGNTKILKTHISADGESIWVFEAKSPENNLPFFARRITRIHAPKPGDWKNN